jgi:hypothetical protein
MEVQNAGNMVIIRIEFVVVSHGIYGGFWQQFQRGVLVWILKQCKVGSTSVYGK